MGEQTQFFQVISINEDTLTYKAYTVLGDEYDTATIKKDFSSGIKTLRWYHVKQMKVYLVCNLKS